MSCDDNENGQLRASQSDSSETEPSSSGSLSSPWKPVLIGDRQQSLNFENAKLLSGIGLMLFIVIFAGFAMAWFWYGATNSAGRPLWTFLVIGILGAALSTMACLALIVGAVKGIGIVINWLAGRIFWLIFIVGGIFATERAVVAYFHGQWDDTPIIYECHLCSSIRLSIASVLANASVSSSDRNSSRALNADSGTCLEGVSEISGRVSNIQTKAETSVVTVTTNGHELLRSVLRSNAVRELGLKENDAVVALVKATDISMVKGTSPDMTAQNGLRGHVISLQKHNAVDCLTIAVGNLTLTSALRTVDRFPYKPGETVTAIFSPKDVLVQKR